MPLTPYATQAEETFPKTSFADRLSVDSIVWKVKIEILQILKVGVT